MKEKKFDEKVVKIQNKAFDKIDNILDKNLDKMDSDVLSNNLKVIGLASKMVNDYNVAKRIQNSQSIRVFGMISEDKSELKKYIEISMPQTLLTPKKR